MITQKELKRLLDYDKDTGVFVWKVNSGTNANMGVIAGTTCSGYVRIQINRKIYLSHRLAWLYVHGYFPENYIDHKNRVKTDNRISNLRHVSHQCNLRNSKTQGRNKSGVKGVTWYKNYRKWVAYITVNSKLYNLCYHEDLTEAVAHRLAAEQCLNWSSCDSKTDAKKYMDEQKLF